MKYIDLQELLWFDVWVFFLSALQIFKYAGQARISYHILEDLKVEVVENTSHSIFLGFS